MANLAIKLGWMAEIKAERRFSTSTISKWENGVNPPSYDMAVLCSHVLRVHLDAFQDA